VPAVSIIVPTWNRRAEVARAVSSVLAQTYADFELIVVDDGSSDGTTESLAGLDDRLRCVYAEHAGVSAARNRGIRLSGGELVAFLDSDNEWLPDHLAVLVEVLRRHPEAVLVSTSPYLRIRGRDAPERAVVKDALPLALAENWIGYVSGIAVRRSVLQTTGGFDERLEAMEDAELWIRMATQGPFAFLRRRTFLRHETAGSLSVSAGEAGLYARESEVLAARAALEIERLPRPAREREMLAERAAGRMQWAFALEALGRGDDENAKSALERAVTMLPELSAEWRLVVRRIALLRNDAPGRQRSLGSAAALWPTPEAVTARALRRAAACGGGEDVAGFDRP